MVATLAESRAITTVHPSAIWESACRPAWRYFQSGWVR